MTLIRGWVVSGFSAGCPFNKITFCLEMGNISMQPGAARSLPPPWPFVWTMPHAPGTAEAAPGALPGRVGDHSPTETPRGESWPPRRAERFLVPVPCRSTVCLGAPTAPPCAFMRRMPEHRLQMALVQLQGGGCQPQAGCRHQPCGNTHSSWRRS